MHSLEAYNAYVGWKQLLVDPVVSGMVAMVSLGNMITKRGVLMSA